MTVVLARAVHSGCSARCPRPPRRSSKHEREPVPSRPSVRRYGAIAAHAEAFLHGCVSLLGVAAFSWAGAALGQVGPAPASATPAAVGPPLAEVSSAPARS